MLIRIQNIAHALLGINKRAKVNIDTEPTKWSWAKQIKSYDTLPNIYKSFFSPLVASGQPFPYVLLTPSFNIFRSTANEKLVCDLGSEIVVLERFGLTDSFETQRHFIDRISHVEVRTILLDSQIKIYSLIGEGTGILSTIKYNSVTDYFFEPILKKIRLAHVNPKNIKQVSDGWKFDCLMNTNHKFMNYARCSLLTGERVRHFIFQPEIQITKLKLFGRTYYKTAHPAHIMILTDWELILIREEKVESDSGKYGGVWTFVPLNKIEKLSLRENDQNLLMLFIQLPGTLSLELPFQVSARKDVNQLLSDFKELTAK